MSRHTPGPWKWRTSNSWRRLSSEHRDHPREGAVLCPVVARDGHPDLSVSESDMALIAAAPDLLEALKAMVEQEVGTEPITDAEKKAVSAIAKAEGRE